MWKVYKKGRIHKSLLHKKIAQRRNLGLIKHKWHYVKNLLKN